MIAINGNEAYTAGTSIDAAFTKLIPLARNTGQVVRLEWNGRTVSIRYSDTPKELWRRWRGKQNVAALRQWKREQRKRNRALARQAKRIAETLPQYLLVWALSPERFYGKRLSILMAADALKIATQYGTADAIAKAVEADTSETVADSGASRAGTIAMATLIANGEFPNQQTQGLVTHAWHKGQEYYNVWKS